MSNVLADTLGIDNLSEYRYQAGKSKRAIYAIDDKYFAVGKTKPDRERVWMEYSDQFFAGKANTKIWFSRMEGE